MSKNICLFLQMLPDSPFLACHSEDNEDNDFFLVAVLNMSLFLICHVIALVTLILVISIDRLELDPNNQV